MPRRVLALLMIGALGAAILIGLGLWQLQRLEWKTALIAELDARLGAEPLALPARPDAAGDNFLRVALAGRIGDGAAYLLTSQEPFGPGFSVIVPVETSEGRRILVDLGFVPEGRRAALALAGLTVRLTGALFWPGERDSFTPAPDLARGMWFARDPQAMAEVLGTEPVLVVADAHDLGDWPRPRRLDTGLRNDHLGYALTWFALAIAWAVIALTLARRERGAAR